MEQQATVTGIHWTDAFNGGLNKLIDKTFDLLGSLLTIEALWLVIGVLVGTHIVKVVFRRYIRHGMLDRAELYLINIGLGFVLAWFIWPAVHLVPWWIAGPSWGTGAHWGFRLFRIFMQWRQPQLYARINFDRRRTRQKRPPNKERRQ